MNISVLGCGRWGSCIAWYLDKIGHNVLSCGLADAPEFIQLKETHKTTISPFQSQLRFLRILNMRLKEPRLL